MPPCASCACAPVTFVPRMNAGCRLYLLSPSTSQVPSHFVGSSGVPPARTSGSVQLSAATSVWNSAVLSAAWTIVPSWPLDVAGAGLAVGDGLAVLSAAGFASSGVGSTLACGEAASVASGAAAPVAAGLAPSVATVGDGPVMSHTGRKFNSAVRWTSSTMRSSFSPGTDTTIAAPEPVPCVVISASATPRPSTRWRRISTACLSCSSVTVVPSVTGRGTRMTWVPPRRSRPRRIDVSVPGQNAHAAMPMMTAASATSARQGL